MKKILLLSSFVLIPAISFPQYSQDISVDLSAGAFKTVGTKYARGVDNYGEDEGPFQMPNYKVGFSGNGGFQFRLGTHLSLAASVGIMISNRWNYKTPDIDNWLSWDFEDTITGTSVTGENYLDFHNLSISV